MSKYKLGDTFVLKNSRDTIPVRIIEISHNVIEDEYTLKPIKLCGDNIIISESAFESLYNKIS